jgi:methylmalonyl-CoA/ethylmalonyl-CoA epimerase
MLSTFRFHHIGYAVKEIAVTADYYIRAGWSLSELQIDTIQNTEIAFLSKVGFPLIEFVAPVNDSSPVVKILEKSGVTTYHICYEVDDINIAVYELRKQKFILLFKPVEAIALNNHKICYLFNKDVGLIELVEIRQ